MSLAAILYPGPTDTGLDEFFHANYQHHLAIISACKESRGVTMELFKIYPVLPQDMDNWLRQHQRQHDVMNQLLGIPGQDISAVDFKNRREFDAWAFQHFIQHQAAGQLCGYPI